MSRLRVCPPGIPQHVVQRGNNRNICFVDKRDFSTFAKWLKEYSQRYDVAVHAWVFMTNHVHLLVTPHISGGLSSMMQALGSRYVRYFNHVHNRTGTLWEGRFKSCYIQSETYLLHCYRYIELNPVRAGMVADPSDYMWSSYHCNALGVESELCNPHEEYKKLGKNSDERLDVYKTLFQGYVQNEALLEQIRVSANKELALGDDRFKDELEIKFGSRVKFSKMGRPKKRPKKVNSEQTFPKNGKSLL